MECNFGMCFKDFAIIASDATSAHSILVNKDDYDKSFKLSDHLLLSVTGEAGDTTQFAEFIAKNVQLYKIRNGYNLTPEAASNFTRRNLADYLRSRNPFMVNMIIAGFDTKKEECELYYIDYLASKVKLPFVAHGYGGFFTTSLMDRKYREDMTREEAYELIRECIQEIHKRLIINYTNFQVKIVDKNGIERLEDITFKKM